MPLTNKPYRSADGPSGNLRKKIAKYLPSLTFHQQGDLHIAPEMGEDLQRIGATLNDAEMSKSLKNIRRYRLNVQVSSRD